MTYLVLSPTDWDITDNYITDYHYINMRKSSMNELKTKIQAWPDYQNVRLIIQVRPDHLLLPPSPDSQLEQQHCHILLEGKTPLTKKFI